uniref:Retrotransposon gag domain-containing protein n=1 Tax=Cajanus cajan TaxID=3821 RepID=A0A151TE26_CAJCA|nr:hypothetical protein KK1_011520 [Cajanus cajan]
MNCSLLSWNAYTGLVRDRFGDVCVDLDRLSVGEYHEEFNVIIKRLNLSEQYILSCFLGGLKKDVQMLVRMFQPTTVQKAFTLARMYEATNAPSSVVLSLSLNKQKGLLGSKPGMMEKANIPFGKNFEANKSGIRSGKTLTPTYMNERRVKDLCYFCDESYSPKHSLSHKKLQIHVMVVVEGEDQTILEETDDQVGSGKEPRISVNTLTGVANFITMRVTGYLQKHPLHILIDSGSTHNFLDIQTAKKFGCKIEEREPLMVIVADGNKLNISSVVKNFT